MASVQMERPLNVPVVPARAAASEIFRDMSEGKGKWGDFALYVSFATLGLPDVGYIAIPASVEMLEERTEPRHEIRFTLHARRKKEAFPTFEGAIGIDGNGPSSSTMWLAGTYTVPMQGLGAMLDQMLASGVAEKSLENMLEELAMSIEAKVQKHELADVRYRLVFKAGD
jgi:hypothetical protein